MATPQPGPGLPILSPGQQAPANRSYAPAGQYPVYASSVPFGPTLPAGPQLPSSGTTTKLASEPLGPNPVSGTSTGSVYPPGYFLHNQTVNGQTYDLSQPDQMAAYLAAQNSNLNSQRNQTLGNLNSQTQRALSAAAATDAAQMSQLNQGATDYGRNLANQVVDLGQNYNLGQVNSQQQFAGLSPNAFQSGQATSQQYGTDQYNKGLTQLHQALGENLGNSYFTNGFQVDPNSSYGQQINQLQNGTNGYNPYVQSLNQSLQQGTLQANQAYQSAADQNASNLQNLAAYSGTSQPSFSPAAYNASGINTSAPGAWQVPSGNPFAPTSVDISQYTPYTTASQLAQSPTAQQPSPATYTGSSSPFASLLGYNPSQPQAAYLNAFVGQPATAAAK